MGVHCLKDGRWYVEYRNKETKTKKRVYFGRRDEAEFAARTFYAGLDMRPYIKTGPNSPNTREAKNIARRAGETIVNRVIAQLLNDSRIKKNRITAKPVSKRANITEKEITKDLVYELAKDRKNKENDVFSIKVEVKTQYGFADVVTSNEVIEVKAIEEWKQGIGQVNVYHNEFPNLKKRLHLFGSANMLDLKKTIRMLTHECRRNKIKMTVALV